MDDTADSIESDIWSRWLLHDRHGGDTGHERAIRSRVDGFVDRVLDAARLAPGMSLADIGTGDGAVALRAIERIGPSLQVHLADISAPLLRHAESAASRRGVRSQCRFYQLSAARLDGMRDASVDAVTTRAVLAYVDDKRTALREFHRILKAGGRLSIAEPLMQEEALNAAALRQIVESRQLSPDSILSFLHRWVSAQYPDTPEKMASSPLANYSERDLFGFVKDSGFVDIHLELHIDMRRVGPRTWTTFLDSAPHPMAPSLGVILDRQFSPVERQSFEQFMRPVIEAGPATEIDRVVYVNAVKPDL